MFKLKEGKIKSYGLYHVMVILVISNLFLGIPRAMAVEGGAAGWLLILLSGAAAGPGIFFIIKLLQRFPGKNFIDIAGILWGRPGAIGVSLVFSAIALYIATVTLREFSETVLTTVLPRTPLSIVSFVFTAAILYGAYRGLETITRSSTLLFPFILGGIFSILLLTGNYINLNNLFPVLGTGPSQLLFHAPGRSSIFVEIAMVGLLTASISDSARVPGQIWKAFLLSLVTFTMVELFYIAVLRVAAAEELYVPLFQLARIIYMGRFVQRIEAIYIFVWFFTGALKLSIALYLGATTLSRGFRIPIYQPLLFPLGLLVYALSFIPGDIVTAVWLDMEILREYGGIIGWGLPLVMLVSSVIQKKGGVQAEENQTGS